MVIALSSMALSISRVPLSETGSGLLVTNKGNDISFPFSLGPFSPIGHAILDRYVVPPLATSGEPPMFHLDWGIHINN